MAEFNIYLCISTFILFIFLKVLPALASFGSQKFFKANTKEKESIKESQKIKEELKKMSMADEFAKYSKLQRKLNVLIIDIESSAGCRQTMQAKLSRTLNVVGYLLFALAYFFILYKYATNVPVFIVPLKWFYPFDRFLSFPLPAEAIGAISFPAWSIMTKNIISIMPFRFVS